MAVINYNIGANSHSNTGIVNVYNENNNSFNLTLLKQFIEICDEKNKRIEELINELKNEQSIERKQLLLIKVADCHEENKQLVEQMKQHETKS